MHIPHLSHQNAQDIRSAMGDSRILDLAKNVPWQTIIAVLQALAPLFPGDYGALVKAVVDALSHLVKPSPEPTPA